MTETNRNRTYRPGLEVVPGYTLVRPLGSGMAGDVWVARAAGGTQVAVKIVRSLSKLGGRKEFQALKTLRNIRHPNLCPVHGFWTKDANGQLLKDGETQSNLPDSSVVTFNRDGKPIKSPESPLKETMAVDSITSAAKRPKRDETVPKAEELIVVMGLGDSTLNDRLIEFREAAGIPEQSNNEVRGLDAQEVIEYLRAASKAIDELNQQHKIYHCDIKPQNILKVGGGIQVCDFGLANRFDGDLRKTQQAFASPAYAAPEVLLGSMYSRTVDQYSLAITYYELRTGVLPFEATTQASVIVAKQNETLDLRHVSPAERKVLRKATKVEPLERYDTCTEFINALALASGVDKQSGITRRRAGIAAAAALALIGGLVFNLLNQDTAAEHFKTAQTHIETSDGKPVTSFEFEDADKVSMAIGPTIEAYHAGPDNQLKGEIRQFAFELFETIVGLVSKKLDDLASWEWANGHPIAKDAKELPDANAIRGFLKSADGLVGKDSILKPNEDGVAALSLSLTLARTQLDLVTDMTPDPKALATLRSSPDIAELTLESSVTVALTHFDAPADEAYYLADPVLSDIERAQRKINDDGLSKLPEWSKSRWTEMKSQFVDRFATFCKNPKTNATVVERILKTWPDVLDDALFERLIQHSSLGQWEEFHKQVQSLPSSPADADHRRAFQAFREMDDALITPSGAKAHIDDVQTLMVPSEQKEIFLVDEFRVPLSEWMRKLSVELLAATLAQKDAEPIYESGYALILMTKGKIPAELDRLAMSSSIKSGADEIASDPNDVRFNVNKIAQRWNGREGVNGILANAILLEQAPKNVDRQIGSSIEALEVQSAVRDEFIKLSSPQIAEYFILLARAASGSIDEALLDESGNSSKTATHFRDSLHPDRQRRIADLFLDLATKRSGVRDDDVTILRFTNSDEGKKFVHHTEWWMDNQSDPSPAKYRRLKTQQLLIKISNCRRLRTPLESVIEFDELHGLVPTESAKPHDGQLYLAAFEFLKDGVDLDDAKMPSERVALLIRASVAICDLAKPDRFSDKQWLVNTMNPVMAVIRKQQPGAIDSKLLLSFVNHYLKTMDLLDQEDNRHLSNLEFATSAAAGSLDLPKERRFQLWIQASDLLQQRMQLMEDEKLSASLLTLEKYVRSAMSIKRQDPDVDVHLAFWTYYKARSEKDAIEKDQRLKKAKNQLETAIKSLQESSNPSTRQMIALYNSYWRHANTLVVLANPLQHQVELMEPMLENAKGSASKAVKMLRDRKFSAHVAENRSQMVLGNSCEDLAHYCYQTKPAKQADLFKDAILAFERSVNVTRGVENALKPRYSLARCKFRFWEAQGGRSKLTEAKEDLGEFSENAGDTDQMKWLVWNAIIQEGLGNRRDAIVEMERAFQIVHDPSKQISTFNRDETTSRYALLLSNDDDEQHQRKAIEIIRTIPSPEWKLIESQSRMLANLGQFSDLVSFIELIPESRIRDFKARPSKTSEHLAVISNELRFAAGTNNQQRMRAADCLKTLMTKTIQEYQRESQRTLEAKAYCEFVRAHVGSLDDSATWANRIRQYLAAFRASEPVKLDPSIIVGLRLALYDQFFNAFEELGAVLKDLQRDELEEAKVQLRRLLDLPNREFLPKDRENVKGLLKFLSPQRPN